jgi:hypothetical protein
MDSTNTSLFKYLQNHITYKIYTDNELPQWLNNQSKYISRSCIKDKVLIGIVPGIYYSMEAIFMEIFIYRGILYYKCYSLNHKFGYKSIRDSELFHAYPTIPFGICHDSTFSASQKEIIIILEKLQILNPEYRNKQFKNITQKCVQTIIYTQNILCNDLACSIVKLLFKLIYHGEDFIWHHEKKLKN